MSDLENYVLVVDDEVLIVMGLCAQLENMGVSVCDTAGTAEQAIALAEKHRPAIVLMDMRLRGEKDGVDAALVIHANVGSKLIYITGSREPSTMARIQLDHPAAVLFKPVSDLRLRAAIETAMQE